MQSTNLISTKAIGYLRVSAKSQADNFSLRSQDEDVRDYCEHEGMLLDRMFTDVGSGLSTKQRPGFLRAREYALDPAKRIPNLVFWDLDRFTRNIEDFFIYTKDLLKAGINLHLALEGEKFDYNSEEKWYQRLIAAQAESKRISRRTKRGQRKATALGHHVGQAPWGYRLVHDSDEPEEKGEKKEKKIECGRLDPETWDDCVNFWDLAKNNYTPMRLTKYMNQHNIPSPGGGLWTDGTARYILKNKKYLGELFWGINPQSRLPGPKENAAPTIAEHCHQPAVSLEDFERINEGIRSRHRSQGPTRAPTSPNALCNILKCGECKEKGEESNLQIHRQNGTVRIRCARKKTMGAEVCAFKTPRLDMVMDVVTGRLRYHFLTKDTLEIVTAMVAEEGGRYLEEQKTSKSGLIARRKDVDDEIAKIGDVLKAAGAKAANLHSLIDHLVKLEKEKADLTKQIDRTDEVSEEALLFVNDREGIIETALNLKTLTDPEDPEAIRELLHIFIERVDLFADGHGVIYYSLPVRSSGPEGTPDRESIYFEKKKGPKVPQSCGFDGSTGVNRCPKHHHPPGSRKPRPNRSGTRAGPECNHTTRCRGGGTAGRMMQNITQEGQTPQARGSTGSMDSYRIHGQANPAGAGINPRPSRCSGRRGSKPRRRGDQPAHLRRDDGRYGQTPQARGSTQPGAARRGR